MLTWWRRSADLAVDHDGVLFRVTDDGDATRLGRIDDPGTTYEVEPAEMVQVMLWDSDWRDAAEGHWGREAVTYFNATRGCR